MWQVTYDYLDQKAVLIRSRNWKADAPLPFKFRMLDDDGEVYYLGQSNDADSEAAFAPLDDYGMPNAGCTEIQYLRNGRWETL